MPTFNNMNSLNSYLQKQTKEMLRQVGLKIEQEMKDYIMKELYGRDIYEYHRTYNFVNSLTSNPIKQEGSKMILEIFFDSDKIKMMDDDKWNQHKSIYGYSTYEGKSINEWIPYWLEYGTDNSPIYNHKPVEVLKYIMDDKQVQKILNEMISYFKTKGINVNVK